MTERMSDDQIAEMEAFALNPLRSPRLSYGQAIGQLCDEIRASRGREKKLEARWEESDRLRRGNLARIAALEAEVGLLRERERLSERPHWQPCACPLCQNARALDQFRKEQEKK